MLNSNADAGNLKDILENNVWTYDPQASLLSYERYNVDLDRMADAEAVLDWIAQVSQKAWATRCVIADLVMALDAILDIQSNYITGSGSEYSRQVDPLPIP